MAVVDEANTSGRQREHRLPSGDSRAVPPDGSERCHTLDSMPSVAALPAGDA
jgi:hypothetical protein